MLNIIFGMILFCFVSVQMDYFACVFLNGRFTASLQVATLHPMVDIMAPLKRWLRLMSLDSIGLRFLRILTFLCRLVTLARGLATSRGGMRCPKLGFSKLKYLMFGVSIIWGRSHLPMGIVTYLQPSIMCPSGSRPQLNQQMMPRQSSSSSRRSYFQGLVFHGQLLVMEVLTSMKDNWITSLRSMVYIIEPGLVTTLKLVVKSRSLIGKSRRSQKRQQPSQGKIGV